MRKTANVLLGIIVFAVMMVSCLYLFGYGLAKMEVESIRLDQIFFAGAFSALLSNMIGEIVTAKFFK